MRHLEAGLFEAHKTRGRLIVVEGDPGAGKTSAIERLCADCALSAVCELDHVRAPAMFPAFDPRSPEDAYVDAERQRQAILRRVLEGGGQAVQDRSILSTLGFLYAFGGSSESGRLRRLLRRLMRGPKLMRPDLLVSMVVSADVSLRRRERFRTHPDYQIWFDKAFLDRFHDFYCTVVGRLFSGPTVIIDTTTLPEAAVATKLAEAVASLDCRGTSDRWRSR